jgi:NAD(P)-dependent dehydrogenase (short-subunit alcohol dehydrogenase family)
MTQDLIRRRKFDHSGTCYICHSKINESHFHYSQMCVSCGNMNYKKRTEFSNLDKYIALVTGGRIKIGFQTSLKLLRSGAFVIITTRFPIDAVIRYSKEDDFNNWKDRLNIYKIDFRNLLQVEKFVNFLNANYAYLDLIINNAAQTVQRPAEYYEHTMQIEQSELRLLPTSLKKLIVNDRTEFEFIKFQKTIDSINFIEQGICQKALSENNDTFFPEGMKDNEGLQLDLRKHNSWISKADEISLIELLEVQLVNVTAPFVFNTRLKKLLMKSPHRQKFIINVSAMEGKFSRVNKNHFHPHTNMAKAALNMFTRTSAQDYVKDGIYMNSVDTGWITDENPHQIKMKNLEKRIKPPLDDIDGAARVCGPIIHGLNTNYYSYGKFFKNYSFSNW